MREVLAERILGTLFGAIFMWVRNILPKKVILTPTLSGYATFNDATLIIQNWLVLESISATDRWTCSRATRILNNAKKCKKCQFGEVTVGESAISGKCHLEDGLKKFNP